MTQRGFAHRDRRCLLKQKKLTLMIATRDLSINTNRQTAQGLFDGTRTTQLKIENKFYITVKCRFRARVLYK